jgi:superfamily I DNA/RNA helicase
MYKPTGQQKKILACNKNCVVAAGPGSGKTSTIAYKIQSVLENMRGYQGVIAISYTNKASNELNRKTEKICSDIKNSFFGTMDSFYISNIIIPFGKHFFGVPSQPVTVEKFDSDYDEFLNRVIHYLDEILEKYENVSIKELEREKIKPIEEIRAYDFDFIASNFREGRFDLRLVGHIANLIFLSSKACRKYFQARYKYLFIDEFQDSGLEQYLLFLRIAEIGIISWAIGDVNQSIYRFANKSSEYLLELMDNKQFKKLPMDINHRCHPSIDFYGKRFLGFDIEYDGDELRIFDINIEGNEIDIGCWFGNELEFIKEIYQVPFNSEIGILARKDITLELFAQELSIPYKIHSKTVLDRDQSLWGSLFSKLLVLAFDKNQSVYNFIDEFFDRELQSEQRKIQGVKNIINEIRQACHAYWEGNSSLLDDIIDLFKQVALIIHPNSENKNALSNLTFVFEDLEQLKSFIPADIDQVQLMNLHKAKGLEFDVVIHLDLYQTIIPGYGWSVKGDRNDLKDSENLHFVGITRARKALILATSSERYQQKNDIFIPAERSEFLLRELENYRQQWEE